MIIQSCVSCAHDSRTPLFSAGSQCQSYAKHGTVSTPEPTERRFVCLIGGCVAVCLAADPAAASALPSVVDCWVVRLADLEFQVLGSSTTGHLLLGPCMHQGVQMP